MCEEIKWTHVSGYELLRQYAELDAEVQQAAKKRDELKAFFKAQMDEADRIFAEETEGARIELELLKEQIRSYTEANLTGKKRSIELPNGTVSLTRQTPIIYVENEGQASSASKRLREFVKTDAPEFLKVQTTEMVDWAGLKKHLKVDGEDVYFDDTGEQIAGLKAQARPDILTVKLA